VLPRTIGYCRLASSRFFICLVLLSGCGDGGSDPIEPATGTLSGTVREAGSQLPIAGATVTAGGVTATAAANGHFELPNLPVGSVTVNAVGEGYDSYAQSVAIQTGTNQHDISMTRRSIYSYHNIAAYLPPAVSKYNGVLFLLPGSLGDSRAFVRGESTCWQPTPDQCPNDTDFRERLLTLAERYGLAVFGANTTVPDNNTEVYDDMLAALVSVASQSGRSEIAAAPLLLIGKSWGGCVAHDFTRLHSERVIGFMSSKGPCHFQGSSPARRVPGYLFLGEEDEVSPDPKDITDLFLANRAEGAIWALAVEAASRHEWPKNNDVTISWMDAVLARRLPQAGAPVGQPLSPVDEASGWLANRSTGAIAGYSCYNGDKLVASWLPSEQTARGWQILVGGNGGVTSCN
jgi:pimeloyl-ACP methyl ester carboxylesterase